MRGYGVHRGSDGSDRPVDDTGKTWDPAANYDLCLNTGNMSIQQAAEVIKCYLREKEYID